MLGGLAASALLGAVFLDRVRAEVDDAWLGIGAHALAFPGAKAEGVRTLVINGIHVSLRTQIVKAAWTDVLSHYRDRCEEPAEGASHLMALASSLAVQSGFGSDAGYVACLAMGARDLASLVERYRRFADTWNLADLGAVRYVFVRRADLRPETRSHLIALWADGPVDLRRLVPAEGGDATGADIEGVWRPPGSRRLLSVHEVDAPSSMVVYLAPRQEPEKLVARYRSQLTDAGWTVVERYAGESIRIDDIAMLAAIKEGRLTTVLADPGVAGRTRLTLLESRASR